MEVVFACLAGIFVTMALTSDDKPAPTASNNCRTPEWFNHDYDPDWITAIAWSKSREAALISVDKQLVAQAAPKAVVTRVELSKTVRDEDVSVRGIDRAVVDSSFELKNVHYRTSYSCEYYYIKGSLPRNKS